MARNPPAGQRTDAKQQKMMQAVFRVPQASPARERTGHSAAVKSTFHARKSHKKSRMGCKSCKQRRIKCDENTQGGCFKCQSQGLDCDYNTEWQSRKKSHVLLPKDHNRSPSHASLSTSEITALVQSSSSSTKSNLSSSTPCGMGLTLSSSFPIKVPDQIMPVILTFNHFNTVTCCSLGSDIGQEIARATALDFAVEKPYLMHAANGVAADHLCHLLPAAQNPIQHGQSQLASLYHWQKALQMFRDELAAGATKHNMDALISTVMLICVHQFMFAEAIPDPSNSFIYAPPDQRNDRLRWLQIHHGFTAMQAALGELIWESVWNPVFQDSEVKEFALNVMTPEAGDETHALLLKFCNITSESSRKNNAYHEALQFLLFLRQLDPRINRFNKLITFVGVIENEFLRLLLERDKRALLILAHWLALMSDIRQWWIGARCKNECIAITTFLMHDRDERVRALLEFPARTVGIVLTQVES